MYKDTTNPETGQEKTLFSFEDVLPDRKIKVDFNAPDISSNGGLVLAGLERDKIARKIAGLIPDYRNQLAAMSSWTGPGLICTCASPPDFPAIRPS